MQIGGPHKHDCSVETFYGLMILTQYHKQKLRNQGVQSRFCHINCNDRDPMWESPFSLVNFPVGFPGELSVRFLGELPAGFLDELPADFSSNFVASLLLVTEIYFRKEKFHFRKSSILGNFIFGESEPKSLIVVLQLTASFVVYFLPVAKICDIYMYVYIVMSRDYVSGRGSRDVWTSDATLVGRGSETSGLATQIVWGVGAETFAFDAALEGGGTETDCTSDAAYASCLFMLELNFHSGSSIYSSQWFAYLASHTSRRVSQFGIRAGFRPGSDPGRRLMGLGFQRFSMFVGDWEFQNKSDTLLSRIIRLVSLVNFPVGFPRELPARFLGELPAGFLDELPADFSSKFVASLLLVTETYFRKEKFHFRKSSILGNFVFGESEPKSLIVVLQLTASFVVYFLPVAMVRVYSVNLVPV
ncbi:hypothetical protein YC2023_043359 [Brassica napus]